MILDVYTSDLCRGYTIEDLERIPYRKFLMLKQQILIKDLIEVSSNLDSSIDMDKG